MHGLLPDFNDLTKRLSSSACKWREFTTVLAITGSGSCFMGLDVLLLVVYEGMIYAWMDYDSG